MLRFFAWKLVVWRLVVDLKIVVVFVLLNNENERYWLWQRSYR